jgi:hypothetical protein
LIEDAFHKFPLLSLLCHLFAFGHPCDVAKFVVAHIQKSSKRCVGPSGSEVKKEILESVFARPSFANPNIRVPRELGIATTIMDRGPRNVGWSPFSTRSVTMFHQPLWERLSPEMAAGLCVPVSQIHKQDAAFFTAITPNNRDALTLTIGANNVQDG